MLGTTGNNRFVGTRNSWGAMGPAKFLGDNRGNENVGLDFEETKRLRSLDVKGPSDEDIKKIGDAFGDAITDLFKEDEPAPKKDKPTKPDHTVAIVVGVVAVVALGVYFVTR